MAFSTAPLMALAGGSTTSPAAMRLIWLGEAANGHLSRSDRRCRLAHLNFSQDADDFRDAGLRRASMANIYRW